MSDDTGDFGDTVKLSQCGSMLFLVVKCPRLLWT